MDRAVVRRGALVAMPLALALALDGCAAIDTIVVPPSGPCEITGLDPGDIHSSFASGAPCIIVTWDSSRFPSALTEDGGTTEPGELGAAAEDAGYLGVCASEVSPANRADASVSDFASRYGSLTPSARVWGASLFLLDHGDGAGKGYCRDWLGIR